MLASFRDLPAMAVSLLVHGLVVLGLLFIPMAVNQAAPELALETIFNDEDREVIEYDQELQVETEVSTTLTTVAGGTVSTTIGATSTPAAAQVKVTESSALKEPTLNPSLNDVVMPSEATIATELGETQIAGETGAIVEGYGAAMSRLTAEILRMMRKDKVLVIWLFDESESMRDDQKEIRDNFHKVYAELGIAQARENLTAKQKRRGVPEVLQTVIASYGAKMTDRTNPKDHSRSRPTAKVEQIKAAIDTIPVDETGAENMCSAISQVLQKYSKMARGRKIAVVVVSDESGDDGQGVDSTIQLARNLRSPIYVLGRESIFGYPYTRQNWTHKETGLTFPLRIRRGPETAFPECLQWDGIHARWDAYGAGFGPYEQVRLARDTGGIFFQLPGVETTLTGAGANEKRKYEALVMKEYQPLLLPRRVYRSERDKDEFRATLWNVISNLNPSENKLLFDKHDSELNMQRWHFPVPQDQFVARAMPHVQRAARAMGFVNTAISMLDKVAEGRDVEGAERWRANYDLAYGQLLTFRLRLYQYLLTIDQHAATNRKPKNEKSNEWNMHSSRKTIIPSEDQYKRIQSTFKIKQTREEYLAMVKEEEKRATDMLKRVISQHAGTPWARRAQYEIGLGYGHQFREGFRDPRYETMRNQIKLPNL